ncbi:GntR family transcriptional regulator [Shinella sp. PSBB067]|uniref:GntR family transcriptional regulator n=1 Tax=unclassified Shinella TaxID=2643062 RepID=UPI00193C65C1|nr:MULTISPECIES: GntR family transcriptional regulator [unclassified Shinella]QRI63818.1 GntR family transcriptional regulator [Shinella sp. PSBB067]
MQLVTGRSQEPGGSLVDQIANEIVGMINSFEIKPGERLNEGEVARRLGVSRTPLREALNRLSTDGFLTVQPAKGFFSRGLSPVDIYQLYQFRALIEAEGARLAAAHGSAKAIDDLEKFLDDTATPDDETIKNLVCFDETFHESVLQMAGNDEMLRVLRSLNQRIRPVRWVDLSRRGRSTTQSEHRQILAAIRSGDASEAAKLMSFHVSKRLEEIDAAVRQLYGQIYVDGVKAIAY